MFCPQCGQQQISGEMRFCARCGFPLNGVIQLLASGGMVATSDAGASPKPLSPRRKGYRQGAFMLLIGMIAIPLLAILSDIGFPEFLVALAAIFFFWGGIIRMIYARIFEDKAAYPAQDIPPVYIPPTGPAQFGVGASQSALPPQRSVPASNWRQPTNTAEMVRPPSVTEHTTRLLDDKVEPPKD
ncbi:MAG: zinc ribbon domain-containing protein [Acidobacteria bacterium]|nr:zinc ribbon domain-containing protein [Acidobacteriota bacterium]